MWTRHTVQGKSFSNKMCPSFFQLSEWKDKHASVSSELDETSSALSQLQSRCELLQVNYEEMKQLLDSKAQEMSDMLECKVRVDCIRSILKEKFHYFDRMSHVSWL